MSPADDIAGAVENIGLRDQSTTSEYRLFGSPGTGKTTTLARQICRAVQKYGRSGALVTSFSRAAAAELVARDLPVDDHAVGTLHSHCFKVLDSPPIAEATVEDWNRLNPHLVITPAKKERRLVGEDEVDEDNKVGQRDGDRLLGELNRLRGRMIAKAMWPASVMHFEKKWTAYKRNQDLLDFTDLIETCFHDLSFAPGKPSVIFADEAQDLNKLQLSLVRRWGEHAEYFILAGDDDQTVYSFAGATPDAILEPDIPTDHKIILRQSHRLPRAVHQFAEKLIHQVTRRQEKIYLPRAEEGAVHRLSCGTYKSPDYFILKSASEHVERGQSVMFLASCAYMLRPIIAVLRKNGIPFHNPYRSSNGFWNPLRFGRPGSSGGRVLALLAAHPDIARPWRPWTYGELGRWTEWLIDPLFLPGARQHIAAQSATKAVSLVDLMHIFQPTSVDTMMAAFEISHRDLLRWWQARLKPEACDRARFPGEIAILRGVEAIYQTPRIVVGTIHSVKGGESDVVYLFPDFSRSGDECYSRGGADHDAVIRLFYVGATRARQTLYICQSDGAAAIRL